MRYDQHTILELALVIRDSRANPNAYDKDSREMLRTACRRNIGVQDQTGFIKRYQHPVDQQLAQQAYDEVKAYAKPPGYTSGVW